MPALYVVLVSQINLVFIIKPTFASAASITVTLELQAQIDAAVDALLAAYRVAPIKLERVDSTDAAFIRL